MNKLIFSCVPRQRLANATIQIILIDNLYKKLNLVYNPNTNSLKAYMQEIIIILQEIIISIPLELLAYEVFNRYSRPLA